MTQAKIPQAYPEREATLGAALRGAYAALTAVTEAALEEAGFEDLRPAHRVVFRHIAPEGSRVTDLARAAGLTKQSMAYLVTALETGGYVVQEPDPEDGRARRVRLSERGEAVMRTLLAASRGVERRINARLGAGSAEHLKALLRMIG
jgi:DNA-binding MarR family transcriptional regulator